VLPSEYCTAAADCKRGNWGVPVRQMHHYPTGTPSLTSHQVQSVGKHRYRPVQIPALTLL